MEPGQTEHLGDGAYLHFDGHGFELRANDHEHPTDRVYLDPEVVRCLLAHIADTIDTGRTLTCVYCGQEYPQGTPASGAAVLTDHIRICEKHPMKKLSDEHAILRRALVGLVGADNRGELEAIEATIRVMPVPEVDRMNTINAVQALLQTSPA